MPNGARHWVFTDFNITDEHRNELLTSSHAYIVFQKEQCPETKRIHFQGFVTFCTRTSLAKAKKLIEKGHLEIARDIGAAIEYCKKEESRLAGPWEHGTPPKFGRVDLDEARIKIKAHDTWTSVLDDEELTEVLTKYYKWSRDIFDSKGITAACPEINELWQQQLFTELEGEPHKRRVIWIWSPEGGTGKSTFAKHVAIKLNALVVTRGGSDDIIHAYDNQKIVIFDYPRSTDPTYIHWNLFEELKNGMTFSKKYNSRQKIFDCPHVVVFSNIDPSDYMHKLSDDRWKIKRI